MNKLIITSIFAQSPEKMSYQAIIRDASDNLVTETDPSVPTGTQTGEMQYWNGTAWITVSP